MKITAIKTFLCNADWRNWLFVKVETDEGIHGWGEGNVDGYDFASEAAIHTMSEYFIGKDPRDIELHWNTIYLESVYRPSFIIVSALAGIEMALWDILGKSLNVPVYRLLGGMVRSKIPAYDNGWFRGATSPEDFAKAASDAVALGFKHLKWDPFGTSDLFPEPEEIARAKKYIKAVREAVGDDVHLLIECHGRFSPDKAIQIAREIEEYKPYFFEEPVPPDNIDALVRVASSINIPVATGERICTHWGAREILEKNGAAVLQPDIIHIGGILETKKLAAMAQAYYIPIAPHNAFGPVLCAASIHVDASTPNFLIQEFFYPDKPIYDEILKEPFFFPVDGFFNLPDRPGLGVDFDEKALSKRPFELRNVGRRLFKLK
ncbi:galactonate dehydratase [Chloroflexota bacterium]